jgi:hypothetical protein
MFAAAGRANCNNRPYQAAEPRKHILSQEDMLVLVLLFLAKKDGLMIYTYNMEME